MKFLDKQTQKGKKAKNHRIYALKMGNSGAVRKESDNIIFLFRYFFFNLHLMSNLLLNEFDKFSSFFLSILTVIFSFLLSFHF
jgi:hypothetical protein